MIPFHVGYIFPKQYLFLNKLENSCFQWFKTNSSLDRKEETSCMATSGAEAIRAAYVYWKEDYFSLLNCGMRYTLPFRDHVGCSALFWQMAKSYASANGHYFDEELGHFCFVDFASQEALALWRKMR